MVREEGVKGSVLEGVRAGEGVVSGKLVVERAMVREGRGRVVVSKERGNMVDKRRWLIRRKLGV